MNDYCKHDFYSYNDNEKGTRRYYIRINHKMIEVSKEVYYVCYNSYRKQLRDNLRDQDAELISYDMPLNENSTLLDQLGVYSDPIESMYIQHQILDILNAINSLDIEDKYIITELLINEKKEQDLAKQYHLTQQMINKRKQRIIQKIKKKLRNS